MIIKIFILTIFIAELIIAFALIFNMIKLSKMAQSLSKQAITQREEICASIKDFKVGLEDFVVAFNELIKSFKRKQEEYTLNMLKNTLIYGAIFLLRGKYKKALLAYTFAKEIYEGFEESYS